MSYLQLAKKIRAGLKPVADTVAPPSPVDQIVVDESDIIATMLDRDEPVAILINSRAIGAPVWFALRDDWKPEQSVKTPVFYPCELPALRTKTPEQLRYIFNVKRVFGGGTVRQ